MPLVRMRVSVACDDLPSRPGAEVMLSPERAQQVVLAGWGEYVRDTAAEVPERRVPRPERAVERPEPAALVDLPETATAAASEPTRGRRRTTRKPKA